MHWTPKCTGPPNALDPHAAPVRAPMKTDELRQRYLEFFETKGCVRRPSDVLVPKTDKSVLFTPAGMNPFKDHFLGRVKLDFTRATTCQKCLRTGDIDNVGRTAYHHTFFEMLGNFSFGDYFKPEAIAWAWEFLTDSRWLNIDAERLTVTVYKDDDEAADIWHESIGLPTSRITRMDEDENFWPASAPSQGPDGVCGPCSEIYFKTDDGGEVEIWNLVFTQFNRVGDPPDNLQPLPSRNIDTGMGLERTAAVLQGVSTNYHIDTLKPIVLAAADVAGIDYQPDSENGRRLRRITDHTRAAVFAIHENTYPDIKGAGSVIRRLIRRAVLDGYQMGLTEPFMHQLTSAVVDSARVPYPELADTATRVTEAIEAEERGFFRTVEGGQRRMDELFESMESSGATTVPGNVSAELNHTFGVPPELLAGVAAERGLVMDWNGYRDAMERHADVSGKGKKRLFETGPIESFKQALRETPFTGYDQTESSVTVKGIVAVDAKTGEDIAITEANADSKRELRVVLDTSPFYAESGGQVGDTGVIRGKAFEFAVDDTQSAGDLIIHIGKVVRGTMHEGDVATASVDVERRDALRRAHSATHILHHALHTHVGRHAEQRGSEVKPDQFRFDFTNPKPIDELTLERVERTVLDKIESGDSISADLIPVEHARQAGAMMLFGEKYPDPCRMVSIGDYSKELCGGTHADNAAAIGGFELLAESNSSTGTRRITALTGHRAAAYRDKVASIVDGVAERFECPPAHAAAALDALIEEVRGLKKDVNAGRRTTPPEDFVYLPGDHPMPPANDHSVRRSMVRQMMRRLNVAIDDVLPRVDSMITERRSIVDELRRLKQGGTVTADDLIAGGEVIDDVTVVAAATPGANPNVMRNLIDQIRKKTPGESAVLLANADNSKVVLVAGMSKGLVARGSSAGRWVGVAAAEVGGGGGGRPDMAQAGGKIPAKLPDALELAKRTLRDELAGGG